MNHNVNVFGDRGFVKGIVIPRLRAADIESLDILFNLCLYVHVCISENY